MKIGIDIDDTIANSWDTFIPAYSKIFDISVDKLKESKPYYQAIQNKISLDEYFKKMSKIHDDLTLDIPLKENVKETIDKLYELGHKVVFITARGKSHSDAYDITKKYLDNHQIKYEKLIVEASEKDKICKEEQINLFIDDSIKHCRSVALKGIEVLLFETNYNKNDKQFKHVKNWDEVYFYIKSRWHNEQSNTN